VPHREKELQQFESATWNRKQRYRES